MNQVFLDNEAGRSSGTGPAPKTANVAGASRVSGTPRIAGVSALLLLFSSTAIAAVACGGIDEKLAEARKPFLKPHLHWSGRHTGRRIIMDRNRNIKEAARVTRDCRAVDVTRGSCVESIQYEIIPLPASPAQKKTGVQSPKKPTFPREENRMTWTVAYDDSTRMTVDVRDDAGHVHGRVMGTVMLLKGKRRIPLEKKRSAAVRIRFDRLPGPGSPVLETRTFTMLGITIGTVETYWTRSK